MGRASMSRHDQCGRRDDTSDDRRRRCVPDKFTTIYSGMEVEPFLHCESARGPMRQELGFRDDEVVVGKIARLFELKGHEYLIEAAAKAVRQSPQLRFLLVGDGLLRSELQQRIDRLQLTPISDSPGSSLPNRFPVTWPRWTCSSTSRFARDWLVPSRKL